MTTPADQEVAQLRAQIKKFCEELTEFGAFVLENEPSEPLSTHNSWMQAEFDGKSWACSRILDMARQVFKGGKAEKIEDTPPPSTGIAFAVGDPVAILDPNGDPLRYGTVVAPPDYQKRIKRWAAGRVYICWAGNPPNRTYSFDPSAEHRVVNLRDREEAETDG